MKQNHRSPTVVAHHDGVLLGLKDESKRPIKYWCNHGPVAYCGAVAGGGRNRSKTIFFCRSEFCTLVPSAEVTSFDAGTKLQDRLNESLEGVDDSLSPDAKIDAMKEDGIIGYTRRVGRKKACSEAQPVFVGNM